MPSKVTRSALAFCFTAVAGAAAAGPAPDTGGGAWWQKCVGIADDHARLQCYDTSVPASVQGNAAAAPAPVAPAASAPPEAAAEAAAPAAAGEAAKTTLLGAPLDTIVPGRFRFAVGYGYGIADYAGRLKTNLTLPFGLFSAKGYTNVSSGLGSSGGTYYAQTWFDRWPGADWSVGLEYLQVRDTGKLNLTLPAGFTAGKILFPNASTATADDVIFSQMGFLNLAYRPRTTGSLRPSLGAGVGPGWAHVIGELGFDNPFLGVMSIQPATSFPLLALQGFAGIEYPILDNVYLAIEPRIIWINGHPFGQDQRYLDFIMGSSLGVNF